MDMVDGWSPAEDSDLKVWDLLSLCLSPNRGASRFYSMTLYIKILERTICLVHLITSDWSRTCAELPHKVHCLLEARENLMTHPAIYESNDPQAWECFGTPLLRNSTPQ
ncbi:hypothetical protein TNCV_2843101 [Trichonephila clavipes]|nr:hypothetical protein TNCV_2843101 [Trichonephila clavipes]